MERFTDKNMSESQITEIVELMSGEHAEALELWGKRNENSGIATGLITGTVITLLLCGGARIAAEAAKMTWKFGKAYVEIIKEHIPG